MRLVLRGGPLDGKEMETNKYLPEWALPYPWGRIVEPRLVTYYRQHPIQKHLYEFTGSRPYYKEFN